MPINVTITKPADLKYPVLLLSKDGCVKLFVNETDGIVLKASSNIHGPMGGIGLITAGTVNYQRDGTECRTGVPIRATDPHWSRFQGEITLAND